jgi:hypothetical protein
MNARYSPAGAGGRTHFELAERSWILGRRGFCEGLARVGGKRGSVGLVVPGSPF